MIKSFFRKNNNYLYLLLFTTCFILSSCFINFYIAVNDSVFEKVEEYSNRDLSFNSQNSYNIVETDIENIPHELYYPNILISAYIDARPFKINVVSNKLNIMQGRNIENDDEIILPLSTCQYLLNKKISVKIYDQSKDFIVVGLYDDTKLPENISFMYFSVANFENILTTFPIYQYHLVVGKYEDVENTIKTLQEKGYIANLDNVKSEQELQLLLQLKNISCVLIIALFIFLGFLIFFLLHNIILDEKENIAIAKSLGYTNLHISLILFFNILILLLISYLISIPLSNGVFYLINFIIHQKLNINLNFSYIQTLFSLSIFISILMVTICIHHYQIKKVNSLLLFKD